jgi:hypothetical protein
MKILEISNKSNSVNAFDVLSGSGFTRVVNSSIYPCRDFFEKNGIQYSFDFPIWNGSKVRIKKDNSNN